MSKKIVNYQELKEFVPDNDYEENYALLTHYLDMPDGSEKFHKRNKLVSDYGFDSEGLEEATAFIANKNVRFFVHKGSVNYG